MLEGTQALICSIIEEYLSVVNRSIGPVAGSTPTILTGLPLCTLPVYYNVLELPAMGMEMDMRLVANNPSAMSRGDDPAGGPHHSQTSVISLNVVLRSTEK